MGYGVGREGRERRGQLLFAMKICEENDFGKNRGEGLKKQKYTERDGDQCYNILIYLLYSERREVKSKAWRINVWGKSMHSASPLQVTTNRPFVWRRVTVMCHRCQNSYNQNTKDP